MIVDIVGWIGASLILIAYYLISNKKLTSNNKKYQLLNLTGALMLMVNAYVNGSFPLTGLNVIWAIVAVKALLGK